MKVRQMKHRARQMTQWRCDGFEEVTYVRKHTTPPATEQELRTTAAMQAQRKYDQAYDQAYIAACELVGPNDIEFDSVLERLMDEML